MSGADESGPGVGMGWFALLALCASAANGCAHGPAETRAEQDPQRPSHSAADGHALERICLQGSLAPEQYCAADAAEESAAEPGTCGLFAVAGEIDQNGDTRVTCSVEPTDDDRIRLAIGLITECSTQRGIDVTGCTAVAGPHHWLIDRAIDGSCTGDGGFWALFSRESRRCAPIMTDPFALQPKGSVIRVRVKARCVGTSKTIWGSAHCLMD